MAAEFNFTDENGIIAFRIQARNVSGADRLCTDQVLTATGFDGSESLDEGVTGDWINLETVPTD
jgi:type II secretory pathway component PulL